MVDNAINCVKIVYERKPCIKCGGQVMTIFVMLDMVYRKCIKCNGLGIGLRPSCKEECMGRLMCKRK